MVNSIFGRNDNIIITDRYAVYNYFNREYRQSCWSHFERDFKRFAHSRNAAISTVGMYLCGVSAELFALRDSLLEGTIELSLFLRRANKLRKRTWRFLKEILNQQESPQASRIAGNILKSEDMMWTFLYDPYSIPLTNNHAERQIRHYVVYRKNSYFTQSERGNTFLERVISLYLTSKLKGENPFLKLTSLVAA